MTSESTLVYVYAILSTPLIADIRGIDGGPLRWVTSSQLAAAVSDVPGDEFAEEPLNSNIANMTWLGPRAVAHQDVNAQLFDSSEASVPLAFGTVFRNDARVQEMLQQQAPTLLGQLARVRGCAEWVVALHLLRDMSADDVAAASPMVRKLRGEIADSSPGRAHLLRQRLQQLERDESRRLQSAAAPKLYAALKEIAVDVYREPLPSDAVERPLLRASVLVRRAGEAEFMDAVDRLRDRWAEPTYRLLLTGPWPPYRFGGLQADD